MSLISPPDWARVYAQIDKVVVADFFFTALFTSLIYHLKQVLAINGFIRDNRSEVSVKEYQVILFLCARRVAIQIILSDNESGVPRTFNSPPCHRIQ
ncbi:hypothetical protein QO208_20965, partial [Salmonella enterica]|uniref:hypothetical protein n=1 Tax=Salmonella enterica TaxID=28901 RepID=UPI0027E118CC